MEHFSVGTVAHYAEILPMTQMVVWIPLSNTISVKKWHIKQLYIFWTLVTTFKLALKLWSANWRICSLPNLQILLMKLYARVSNVKFEGHLQDMGIASCGIDSRQHVESKWEEVQLWKYCKKKIHLGRSLEKLGILNERFTHVGNDKLKPYEFPIHDCVYGFSRKVVWLKVTRSNNNPVVPASYFLETVSKWNLVPNIFRTD